MGISRAQSTSDDELIAMRILALRYEAQQHKPGDCHMKPVIPRARTKARERQDSEAERALEKASLPLEKYFRGFIPGPGCLAIPGAPRRSDIRCWCRPASDPKHIGATETRPCSWRYIKARQNICISDFKQRFLLTRTRTLSGCVELTKRRSTPRL